MKTRCYESKRFGFKLEEFRTWLRGDLGAEFNFSSISSPLAQYITQTHKTIWGEVILDYYWIHGKGYIRRGLLPYWALAMYAKLAHQAETDQIGVPFKAIDTLVALRGL